MCKFTHKMVLTLRSLITEHGENGYITIGANTNKIYSWGIYINNAMNAVIEQMEITNEYEPVDVCKMDGQFIGSLITGIGIANEDQSIIRLRFIPAGKDDEQFYYEYHSSSDGSENDDSENDSENDDSENDSEDDDSDFDENDLDEDEWEAWAEWAEEDDDEDDLDLSYWE